MKVVDLVRSVQNVQKSIRSVNRQIVQIEQNGNNNEVNQHLRKILLQNINPLRDLLGHINSQEIEIEL